ncbi:hypothetical protein HK102_003492 [Quaeritorhiza haematococci]|nr:hypothetical protein HK102_003492 [Quaeritorhiza haematococci]
MYPKHQQGQPAYAQPPQQYYAPPPQGGAPVPYGTPPQQHHQHAPPHAPAAAPGSTSYSTPTLTGSFGQVRYEIMYRDANTLLKVVLPHGDFVTTRTGAMVGMSPTMKIEGKFKGLKALVTSSDSFRSNITAQSGPGEVLIAPQFLGDILPIVLDGATEFNVSKGQFLAMTSGVKKSNKSQGLGQGILSGEGMFIDKFSGQGIVFLQVLGAVHPIDLGPGQEYIIDNGHLVAWAATTRYRVEKVAGFFSSMTSGEGYVCKFTGPGRVYIQTRNPDELRAWFAVQGTA